MTISPDNKRVIITIPKCLHEQIAKQAESENRSVSNMIVTILMKQYQKDN